VRCFFTNEKCNEMMRMRWISLIKKLFSDINISQGSVATRLRRGGIFIECCIANFSEIITVKEFLNRPIFDEVMCRAFGVHFFWPTLYVSTDCVLVDPQFSSHDCDE